MSLEPMLAAQDVWFSYNGGAHALRGATLAVQPGCITMILGRSGSGKTTLLRALKGLITPQRGSVSGRVKAADIAYLPQTLGLVRSLSALDNTLMGALNRTGVWRSLLSAFPRRTVDEAAALLANLGLSDKVHEPVYALSGGERQRVAIARALMQHPKVILADEFVSQLDPLTAEEILQRMRTLVPQGLSFLVTTHETDVIEQHADQLLVMKDGAITYDSRGAKLTPKQMLELIG